MGIFKKLFGKEKAVSREALIHAETDRLWLLIKETLAYYDTIACPCAFPRFIQYASIDCVGTGMGLSFYMSETEGFIHHCGPYYNIQQVDKENENYRAIYTCKKCSSTFICGWQDLSIHVDRTYLKPTEIKIAAIGAGIKTPVPYVVGLFGHRLPPQNDFVKLDLGSFKEYISELKNG